jgi:hypothetical protein
VSFETEPPPLAAAEPGVSDARPAPPPTAEPSAAAQAAERRRAADEAHQARVDEQVADAGDALADAEEAVESDQGQLDLDWHPRG